ncbi:MAG: hypothetical protein RLO17_02800 [Cyclobacteriaceae bacterium]
MRLQSLALISFFILSSNLAFAQPAPVKEFFSEVRLYVDSAEYTWTRDRVRVNDFEEKLAFRYNDDHAVMEVYLFKKQGVNFESLELIKTEDFEIVDPVVQFETFARFKVRFRDLDQSNFLKFMVMIKINANTTVMTEIPLQAYTETYVDFYPTLTELYIGEEKTFELTTNNIDNIQVENRWTEGLPIDYRVTRSGEQLFLHLVPNELGSQLIEIDFMAKNPSLKNGKLTYKADSIYQRFRVMAGRLAFLQFDKQEVTPQDDKASDIEIQLDNHYNLKIGKTYRVENQEAVGGPLIAELFTKNRLNNDKILCLLRVYAFHRKSDGYLYIKDGDEPRFVTNLDITPKTNIQTISIKREGRDWEKSNVVYPGETIGVRFEGDGMHKANFAFQGIGRISPDSAFQNENIASFEFRVPMSIASSKIEIFNHNQSTGKSLSVREYQKPKAFDYVILDFGDEQHVVSDIDKPIYYDKTITDLIFSFDRALIDQNLNINGVQYLTIDVKVSNKKGNLIELYKFDQLAICPSERSPRHAFYNIDECRADDVNLNNHLAKKTFDLEEWSRIDLTVSHVKDKYGGRGQTKKIVVYLKRDYTFDIDVSFPSGLLIFKSSDDPDDPDAKFANFGGISFAMMWQMSFYQPGKIAKYRPYKIGAGFIALNAFNFAENADQDIGLVVIGSLYPISSDNKLSFPLHMGFGYLLDEQKMFGLIGPGIRVRL